MNQPQRLRVLIVCDHSLFRRSLSLMLSRQYDLEVVGEASTAAGAREKAAQLRPEVVVLDAHLLDQSGIEAGRDLRSQDPGIKVLLLASYGDDQTIIGTILAGASGYVLKEMRSGEIIEAVRRVGRGQSLLNPVIVQRVLDRIKTATHDDELNRLTPLEYDILEHIVAGKTNQEIAAAAHLEAATLKDHISNILCKLEVTCRYQAVVYMTQWRTHRSLRIVR